MPRCPAVRSRKRRTVLTGWRCCACEFRDEKEQVILVAGCSSRGENDSRVECRDARRCDRARGGQSSPAGAAALASFEMRKSRSYWLQVADRGRTEARLRGGESFEDRHRAATSRTPPGRTRSFGRCFGSRCVRRFEERRVGQECSRGGRAAV